MAGMDTSAGNLPLFVESARLNTKGAAKTAPFVFNHRRMAGFFMAGKLLAFIRLVYVACAPHTDDALIQGRECAQFMAQAAHQRA